MTMFILRQLTFLNRPSTWQCTSARSKMGDQIEETEKRSIDFAKSASVDLVALNNEVVNMRGIVRAAKVHVAHKLSRGVQKLRAKKGTPQQKEKNERKAQRMVEEILTIKRLNADKISKFALNNRKSYEEVAKEPGVSVDQRSLCRLSEAKVLAAKVAAFRRNHPDWEELAAYLQVKQTGRRFRTKLQKVRAAKRGSKFLLCHSAADDQDMLNACQAATEPLPQAPKVHAKGKTHQGNDAKISVMDNVQNTKGQEGKRDDSGKDKPDSFVDGEDISARTRNEKGLGKDLYGEEAEISSGDSDKSAQCEENEDSDEYNSVRESDKTDSENESEDERNEKYTNFEDEKANTVTVNKKTTETSYASPTLAKKKKTTESSYASPTLAKICMLSDSDKTVEDKIGFDDEEKQRDDFFIYDDDDKDDDETGKNNHIHWLESTKSTNTRPDAYKRKGPLEAMLGVEQDVREHERGQGSYRDGKGRFQGSSRGHGLGRERGRGGRGTASGRGKDGGWGRGGSSSTRGVGRNARGRGQGKRADSDWKGKEKMKGSYQEFSRGGGREKGKTDLRDHRTGSSRKVVQQKRLPQKHGIQFKKDPLEEASHPSWEAKRKQKLLEKTASFSGKRIKFD